MGTRKLYYEDAGLLETDARIVSLSEGPRGWVVVLDRTVVFPGGGGQPADLGWVGDLAVTGSAVEGEDVLHTLGSTPADLRVGGTVRVRVDPQARRESAQQHTGQHIVSACLVHTGDYHTVSVHIGQGALSVECAAPHIPTETLRAVEMCANSVICRNLEVRTHLVPGEELDRFHLRRAAKPREAHRIVEIPDHDASACGGVHVSRTGDVGLVAWVGTERIRGNCRTHWLVGDRAYRDYAAKTELAQALSAELSTPGEDILAGVRRIRSELSEGQARVRLLEELAAGALAERLVAGAARHGGLSLVVEHLEGIDGQVFRALGRVLSQRRGVVAVLANQMGQSAQLWACRDPGLDVDLGALLGPHLAVIEGKGGGREAVWQGVARQPAALGAFLAAVEGALRAARPAEQTRPS
jgi:alanyl-tRNA synthetase